MKTEDQITIELILEEASAWGLRYEVEATAKEIIKESIDIDEVSAYQDAYNEWIK
jgi:hypothetical protein